jgi:hypothetical protein
LYDHIAEDQKGEFNIYNCHKYSFNSCNNEGYYRGQYRYKYTELPWGEFYKLQTNWKTDFHHESIILNNKVKDDKMNHFIFFFRDSTFECVAEDFEFNYLD